MANFQPPPTWADPVIVDEKSGSSKFNPVWLKWFVDLIAVLDQAGGTTIDHNETDSIQGGAASQRFHLTLLQHGTIGTDGSHRPATPAGAAQTACGLYAGSGAPNNGDGANGDFYFRSDGTAGGDTVIYHKESGAWVALVTS